MSLKVFHMVFIAASIVLSIGVGVWELRLYGVTRSTSELSLSLFFFVMGAALVAYGIRTFQKLRELQ